MITANDEMDAADIIARFPAHASRQKSPETERFIALQPGKGLVLEGCKPTKNANCSFGSYFRQAARIRKWKIRQWHGPNREHVVVRDA